MSRTIPSSKIAINTLKKNLDILMETSTMIDIYKTTIQTQENIIQNNTTVVEIYKKNIDDLQTVVKQISGSDTAITVTTHAPINITIKTEYILYMQKYGLPKDGIFLENKLLEFITK
jgi:hypothetical protein